MSLLTRRPRWLATVLLVPLLSLATPGWLRLDGVAPAWPVLWLLPWGLVDGRFSGVVAGLMVGMLADAFQPGGVSQAPALALLGWWWGRLGRRPPPIERVLGLGLLALVGTLLLDLSLMLQWALWHAAAGAGDPAALVHQGWTRGDLRTAGLHVLAARTLLTALLAPVVCSPQLLFWRHLQGATPGRA